MKKEAKRLEKEAKLAAKAAKAIVKGPVVDKKQKEKKEKKDVEKPFVNTTPPGQKKGAYYQLLLLSNSFLLTVMKICLSRCRVDTIQLLLNRRGMSGGMLKVFLHLKPSPMALSNQKGNSSSLHLLRMLREAYTSDMPSLLPSRTPWFVGIEC